MNSTEDNGMTKFEKFIKAMARRYAKRQKFWEEVEEIKYGKNGRRKMPTGKKFTIFLLINFTVVEIYTLFIMYYLRDISALPTLITSVIGEVITLIVYQIKSLKENTASSGFMYELKMKDAEQGIIDDNAVG